MADLTKATILHRLRVLFDDTGIPHLVETVHRDVVKEGDKVLSAAGEMVRTVSPEHLKEAVAAFMAVFEKAYADEQAAKVAAAQKVLDDAAAAQKAADDAAAAAQKAAEDAADKAATAAAAAAAAPPATPA